jgi:septal ring factor EnvC (AmiA/AmiB activator)
MPDPTRENLKEAQQFTFRSTNDEVNVAIAQMMDLLDERKAALAERDARIAEREEEIVVLNDERLRLNGKLARIALKYNLSVQDVKDA